MMKVSTIRALVAVLLVFFVPIPGVSISQRKPGAKNNLTLTATHDASFKHVFGYNTDILKSFINEMLKGTNTDEVEEIWNVGPALDRRRRQDKLCILDVRCRDTSGGQYIVEMQQEDRTHCFAKRAQHYVAQIYARQLETGNKYGILKKVVFIGILGCSIFSNTSSYITKHNIRTIDDNKNFLADSLYIFMELPKFHKNKYNLENLEDRWAYFFKKAHKTSKEEFDEVSGGDIAIKKAYEVLNKFNKNKEYQTARDEEERNTRDRQAMLDYARDEGEMKGEVKEKIKVAKTMLADNANVSTIAKYTGLSTEQINMLKGNSSRSG